LLAQLLRRIRSGFSAELGLIQRLP
jgi:hypothetical protein